MTAGFDDIRGRLPLRGAAEREGLKVKRWGRGIQFDCPVCRKGGRDGSGARARDGVTWRCVRCMEGGDVVDLLRLSRGLDAKGAYREACELAGLPSRGPGRGGEKSPSDGREVAKVTAPDPDRDDDEGPAPVGADDLAERLRALGLAALHYGNLAGLRLDDEDQATAREHVDFLAELDREGFGATARRSPDGYLERPDLETARRVACDYLMARLGAAWPDVRAIARELVGLCPVADSGLAAWLRYHGGEALLEAAFRADLIRTDGRERFAGFLVYFWHDDRGRVVYMTGRAVPGLHRDPKAKLCASAPHNNEAGFGLPLPTVPFGGWLADKLGGPVWIVEGELDALHGLADGPTVATGGAGRMGGRRGVEALKRWLRGRDAIVAFDDEDDPVKRAEIDRRAMELARAVGCRWAPAGGDGGIAEEAEL